MLDLKHRQSFDDRSLSADILYNNRNYKNLYICLTEYILPMIDIAYAYRIDVHGN